MYYIKVNISQLPSKITHEYIEITTKYQIKPNIFFKNYFSDQNVLVLQLQFNTRKYVNNIFQYVKEDVIGSPQSM